MALDKKGVFFTFIAFIFLSLLVFSLSVGNKYELREDIFVIETRVDTMDHFISDVDKDIERGAYIAGVRAFFALREQIISSEDYISNLNSSFTELFINGTINGSNSSILANNTFTDWMNRIGVEASKIDIIINFTIHNISLYQEDPWYVTVKVDLGMRISDKENISYWDKEKSIRSNINIEGLEDPLYWLGTGGIVESRIIKTNFTYFVDGTNISNLLNHTYKGYYIAFSKAPGYLMRLEGDFSSSEYGIERLVDIHELSINGVRVYSKSIVDHIYFSDENTDKYRVQGAPSWFKLDNRSHHLDVYEVGELIS